MLRAIAQHVKHAYFNRARALARKRGELRPRCSTLEALVFAAHPDDETLGCGGLISLKRAQGVPVTVVFFTDGEEARMREPKLDRGRVRRGEALAALKTLGVERERIHFLGFPDARLSALSRETRAAAVDRAREFILAASESAEVFVPHHHDDHPDHEAANVLVREAAIRTARREQTLFEYPVWLFWSPRAYDAVSASGARTLAIDVSTVRQKKLSALAAYRSQIPLLGRHFVSAATGRHEIFFRWTKTTATGD